MQRLLVILWYQPYGSNKNVDIKSSADNAQMFESRLGYSGTGAGQNNIHVSHETFSKDWWKTTFKKSIYSGKYSIMAK